MAPVTASFRWRSTTGSMTAGSRMLQIDHHEKSMITDFAGFILVGVVILAWCLNPIRRCKEAREHANDPPPSKPVVKTHETSDEERKKALVDLFENSNVEAVSVRRSLALLCDGWSNFF